MLNKLVKLANQLDKLGLFKEADLLDELLKKATMDPDEYEKYYGRPMDEERLKQFEQEFTEEHTESEEKPYDMDNPDFTLTLLERNIMTDYFKTNVQRLEDLDEGALNSFLRYLSGKMYNNNDSNMRAKFGDFYIKASQFYDKMYNPINGLKKDEANAEDKNELSIFEISKKVKDVVSKAKAKLGEDLAGYSMLDLVADNLPYPLDVLKKALIVANVGYKPVEKKEKMVEQNDIKVIWPYYFDSAVAVVGNKMLPAEELEMGDAPDKLLRGQKIWVKFDDKQGYLIKELPPLGPFNTKEEAKQAVSEFAEKNNFELYYGD
jgi:hypothetical protein